MNSRRIQHLIPASVVLALAAVVIVLSFTQEPAAAFLFPRIISVVMFVLAFWNFMRAAMGLAKVGGGIPMGAFLNIAPGLTVIGLLVFLVLTWLGFYAASFIAFLALYTIYDPVPLRNGQAFLKRIAVTTCFIAVIYGLFDRVLQVQTPSGLFF
ncbi:tripartite tricarboxylate transporter TctB family protein [Sulfitobacter aestuarii]|uniref:Tripartite tricarboxylate transporter TctB family protein n=1 Tax=Sulfitobacter aestuarii TaxID=2161676 RepID=A0ABW5U8K5_9RHOB